MKKSSFIFFLILTFGLNGLEAQIKYESEAQKLGTQFKIIFYCADANTGDKLAAEAWALVDELNMIFSDYEPSSEITLLSKSAGTSEWIGVSDRLWEVLTLSHDISVKTQGAFDITIGPLSKLWRRAFRRNILPQESEVAEAKDLVNYKWIHFNKEKQSVFLEKPDMRLDLGGIAKGYIIDRVFQYFSDKGINEVLVDGGGDIFVGAAYDSEAPWKLSYGGADQISNGWEHRAIASSGDHFRYLEYGGMKYSHIIDPRTGYGSNQPSQVVISAPSCVLADALASTISILGMERGQEFLTHFPNSKLEYLEKHKL
ncbi:MAG: thiamine biosynthesis lipoprotein [Saprospiraceae bacterium]